VRDGSDQACPSFGPWEFVVRSSSPSRSSSSSSKCTVDGGLERLDGVGVGVLGGEKATIEA
jgi:hypothetical protein